MQTDDILVRQLVDYRHAYNLLVRSASQYASRVKTQIEDALRQIEHELRQRGLEQYLAIQPARS